MHTATKHWSEKFLTGIAIGLVFCGALAMGFLMFLSFAMRAGSSPMPWDWQAVFIALGPLVYAGAVYSYRSDSKLAKYYHAALFANSLIWMPLSVGLVVELFLAASNIPALAGIMLLFSVVLILSVIDWYLTRSGISIAVIVIMLFMAFLMGLKMMQLRNAGSCEVETKHEQVVKWADGTQDGEEQN